MLAIQITALFCRYFEQTNYPRHLTKLAHSDRVHLEIIPASIGSDTNLITSLSLDSIRADPHNYMRNASE